MQFQFNTVPFAHTVINAANKASYADGMESKDLKLTLCASMLSATAPKCHIHMFLIIILQFKHFKVEDVALVCSNNKNPAKKKNYTLAILATSVSQIWPMSESRALISFPN